MEQVIEVGSIWIGKINRQTELEVMSFNSEKVKVKVLSNGSDVSSVDVTFYMSKDYFLKSYARQVSMEYLKGYEEGYKFGHSDAIEEYNTNLAEIKKYHYDMGYNDALTHIASEEAENRLEIKKQGFEDGYNFAVKELSNSQALGETTEYEFGADGGSEHHNPNKETQEAMQEVFGNSENEFEGIWISKQHNPDWKIEYYSDCGTHVWMKVLDTPHPTAYVVGDLFTISKERLKSDYTELSEDNSAESIITKDEQLKKELELVEKYPHYYKDIRHLNIIDIYRFFDLFEVTDPCIQHSMKKLAVGGKRGAKDYEKDIKEAMDTLKRWEYMQEENKRGLDD